MYMYVYVFMYVYLIHLYLFLLSENYSNDMKLLIAMMWFKFVFPTIFGRSSNFFAEKPKKVAHYTFLFYKQSIFDLRPENCLSFSKKLSQKII